MKGIRYRSLGTMLLVTVGMSLWSVRLPARYGASDKNEQLLQRVTSYYSSFEKQDYPRVWDHFGERMREQHPSREDYAVRMSKYYDSIRVVTWPSGQNLTWVESGTGDSRRKLAKFETPLQVRTKFTTGDLPIKRTTLWSIERFPNSQGPEPWVLVFQEDSTGSKQSSIAKR